jgi:RHS repeat-associated protein
MIKEFTYTGNEMTTAGTSSLYYDLNGNQTIAPKDTSTLMTLSYNWENKLKTAYTIENPPKGVYLTYDPAGNRIQKVSSTNGGRKYIVDVVGDLPVILMEIDPADMSIKKCYIYANAEILSEHDGGAVASQYYYLHDRLGSVRQVITSVNSVVSVAKTLTYSPFGETIDSYGDFYTPWQFTGQYCDSETGQYYLRARQYSPYLSRFTGRDLLMGDVNEPLTLHRYLYCQNNSINAIDPWGLDAYLIFDPYGGPGLCEGSREAGHVDIGVDDQGYPSSGIIVRSAHWGSVDKAITTFKNIDQASSYGNKFVIRFKNIKLDGGGTSDGNIWTYLITGMEPSGYKYCSSHAKDALAFGGYDLGFGVGVTPKVLMYAAIIRNLEGDKNIEIDPKALYYFMEDIFEHF